MGYLPILPALLEGWGCCHEAPLTKTTNSFLSLLFTEFFAVATPKLVSKCTFFPVCAMQLTVACHGPPIPMNKLLILRLALRAAPKAGIVEWVNYVEGLQVCGFRNYLRSNLTLFQMQIHGWSEPWPKDGDPIL